MGNYRRRWDLVKESLVSTLCRRLWCWWPSSIGLGFVGQGWWGCIVVVALVGEVVVLVVVYRKSQIREAVYMDHSLGCYTRTLAVAVVYSVGSPGVHIVRREERRAFDRTAVQVQGEEGMLSMSSWMRRDPRRG